MTKKFVAYQLLIDVIDYSLMLLIIAHLCDYTYNKIMLYIYYDFSTFSFNNWLFC